ncbi:MAG: putative Nudix hydrolase NudL [Gammaproteobacteria bacterium]|nr:putative Nudix hydrolase NudL [Gammaproteobacteria bacterium]
MALIVPERGVLAAVDLAAALSGCLRPAPEYAPSFSTPALRPAAVLIPIVSRREGNAVLFTRRAPTLTHHAGQICFPGGTVSDADATYAQAALRELEEETGIAQRHVHLAGALPALDTRTGFSVVPVVGVIEEGFRLVLQQSEVTAVFEIPLPFVLNGRNYQTRPVPDRDQARVFDTIQYGSNVIWGATATMLVNLVAILNGLAPDLHESLRATRGNCDF